MEFQLNPIPDMADAAPLPEATARGDGSFSISSEPVVAENGADAAAEEVAALPRSDRTQSLWLMPRDPQSLFALWDIDWYAAFGDERPAERKVHVRLMRADGSEETAVAVEPMAGNCYIPVAQADEFYTADLGFYQPAGGWNSVALSAAVQMPSSEINEAEEGEFATIPLHLSFQRMIDAFRVSHHESASLTEMLGDLRARVAAADETSAITSEEREIVRALDNAAPRQPEPQPPKPPTPDLWARVGADRVLGFGATSPRGGFGGSSRV
jgi:hypothetical protein